MRRLFAFAGSLALLLAIQPNAAMADQAKAPQLRLPLRLAAEARNFKVGASVSQFSLSPTPETDDPQYMQLLCSDFNLITPGNELKWDSVQPVNPQNPDLTQSPTYSYTAAEHRIDEAASCGQKVIGHTLVWHEQLPAWVSTLANQGTTSGRCNDTTERTAITTAFENHIRNVVTYFAHNYPGQLWAWDVVNEAMGNGSLRSTVWSECVLNPSDSTDTDYYIGRAFSLADDAQRDELGCSDRPAACPGAALLFYNDFGTESDNPASTTDKSDKVYDLLSDLLDEGYPIDGVGFQTHTSLCVGLGGRGCPPGDTDGMNIRSDVASNMQPNLQRFSDDLGLVTRISEMDVALEPLPVTNRLDGLSSGDPTIDGVLTLVRAKVREVLDLVGVNIPALIRDTYQEQMIPEMQRRDQGNVFAGALDACLDPASNCLAFTVWGVMDKYSWLNFDTDPSDCCPLLYDDRGIPKVAYAFVLNAMLAD